MWIFKESFSRPFSYSVLRTEQIISTKGETESHLQSFSALRRNNQNQDPERYISSLEEELIRLQNQNNELRSSQVADKISPKFKLIFVTVTSLTCLFVVFTFLLSWVVSEPNEQQKETVSMFASLSQAGFVGILGLLGGKAL
jgi:hypothetical protein